MTIHDPDGHYPGQPIVGDCKWPFGGGATLRFCGRPVLRRRCPYCEEHAEAAFVAIDPNIDKKFMAGAIKAADR